MQQANDLSDNLGVFAFIKALDRLPVKILLKHNCFSCATKQFMSA